LFNIPSFKNSGKLEVILARINKVLVALFLNYYIGPNSSPLPTATISSVVFIIFNPLTFYEKMCIIRKAIINAFINTIKKNLSLKNIFNLLLNIGICYVMGMLLNVEITKIVGAYFIIKGAWISIQRSNCICSSEDKKLLENIFTDLFSNLFNFWFTNLWISFAKHIMSSILRPLIDKIILKMDSGGNNPNLSGGPGGGGPGVPGGGPGVPGGGPGGPGGGPPGGGPVGGPGGPGGGSDRDGESRKRKFVSILPKPSNWSNDNNNESDNLPKRRRSDYYHNKNYLVPSSSQPTGAKEAWTPFKPQEDNKYPYDATRDVFIVKRLKKSLRSKMIVRIEDTATKRNYECDSLSTGAAEVIADLGYQNVGSSIINKAAARKNNLLYGRFVITRINVPSSSQPTGAKEATPLQTPRR
jgi:hypothetical protein